MSRPSDRIDETPTLFSLTDADRNELRLGALPQGSDEFVELFVNGGTTWLVNREEAEHLHAWLGRLLDSTKET